MATFEGYSFAMDEAAANQERGIRKSAIRPDGSGLGHSHPSASAPDPAPELPDRCDHQRAGARQQYQNVLIFIDLMKVQLLKNDK